MTIKDSADIIAPGLTGAPTARQIAANAEVPSVVILAGGLSHERDISLRSGRRVAELLRGAGCEVFLHDVDASLLQFLLETRPTVVWPLLHGAGGEDGGLRGILELIGQPYVGTTARAARLNWDKPTAKERLATAGLSTPDWITLQQVLFRDLGAPAVLREVAERFGVPVVVKPARGGSALGVTRVEHALDLGTAMINCFAYCDSALIERAISGTELGVSVIDGPAGLRALPPVEIVVEGAYDYDARYNPGRVVYYAPARLSPAEIIAVQDVALAAHRALDLRHLSRTDLILDADGVAQILEVNVAPGMTEVSLFPLAAASAGFDLGSLYRDLVVFAGCQ